MGRYALKGENGMKPIDFIILTAVALAVIGIAVYLIRKKLKGETGCGCSCANCPSANACGEKNAKKDVPEREMNA